MGARETRTGARRVTARVLGEMPLPRHEDGESKEGRGSVLVVAGAVELPGAAVLAAEAALRAGAGKLRVATCRSIAAWVGIAVPESRVYGLGETRAGGIAAAAARELAEIAGEVDAVILGPGMVGRRAIVSLLERLLPKLAVPVVLDAAALGALGTLDGVEAKPDRPLVLTPHDEEFEALTGEAPPEDDAARLEAVRAAARRFRAVVLLKGAGTLTVDATGAAFRNVTGNVGLGTSGSGDVLAGLVGGLVARGAAPTAAAVWGAWAHGRAGDRLARRVGPVGFLARELLAEIPAVLGGRSE
jgi:ADP-dependent NAD(P)H-hydrate dehydratase